MRHLALMAACAVTLAGCGAASGNSTGFLDDGKDVSFLQQGTTSCPNIADSGNPIYERYPLRCGPQTQVIPN